MVKHEKNCYYFENKIGYRDLGMSILMTNLIYNKS